MEENRYEVRIVGHRRTIKCRINNVFIVSNTSVEAVNENSIIVDNA